MMPIDLNIENGLNSTIINVCDLFALKFFFVLFFSSELNNFRKPWLFHVKMVGIMCDPSREKGRVGCHIVKFTFSAF